MRVLFVLGVAVCLIAPSGQVWATGRVVVADRLESNEKIRKEAREVIKEALLDGSYLGVVFAEADESNCDTPACFAALAKKLKATYVLVAQGIVNASGYRIALEVRDGNTGRILGSDSKECELCDTVDLRKALSERVQMVMSRVESEDPPAVDFDETDSSQVASPEEEGTSKPPSLSRGFWQQPLPVTGLALAGAGLVVIGTGIYLWDMDGQCSDNRCITFKETSTTGKVLVGTGLAVSLVGAGLLGWGRDAPVAVAFSHNRIWLNGSF